MRLLLVMMVLLWAPVLAEPWALYNAVVHTALEAPFQGYVVVDGESIKAVGRGAPPAGLGGVDLEGQHLYPALIDPDSSIGLVDIESVKGSVDVSEVEEVNPNLRAHVAFRAESDLVEVARSQGLLVAGVQPGGGLISGQGSVMRLWGWTWQEMTVKPGWCMTIDWPAALTDKKSDDKDRQKFLKGLGEKLYLLREAFASARSFQAGNTRDVKWEALADAAAGRQRVLIRVNSKSQIARALEWSEQEKIRPVLVTGYDIEEFAQELSARRIDVIFTSLNHPVPRHKSYDTHYAIPARLRRAGVRTALSAAGWAFDARELRDLAGRSRSFGQSELQALQSVTLEPARILGVDHRLGSLEPGKEATLVVCRGDLLEVSTRVTRAWGQGRELDLQDRQKRLYEKYRARPNATPR